MAITGMHHLTAIMGDLEANVSFFPKILGLRLVKRTVIQEEPETYHLFYGDRVGTIGTDLSFFHWPHVKQGRIGARNVLRSYLAVPSTDALDWWENHLTAQGVALHRVDGSLHFDGPEAMPLGLVAGAAPDSYAHWPDNIAPEAHAIRTIHSVDVGVNDIRATQDFLTDVFGFAVIDDSAHSRVRLGVAGGGTGKEIIITQQDQAGFRGLGSMHHIALSLDADDDIDAWHDRLVNTGLKVTDVVRRYYFDSVYVRVPGGMLFELATPGRGLAVDEEEATIGQHLALPPFLEVKRTDIENQLPPFPTVG